MDFDVEIKFRQLLKQLEPLFGGGLDVQAVLFIIGVQELGMGYKKFKKHEKTDLMHIALCTLLEPYGYYEYKGKDKDNWPHFELIKELPFLEERDQQHLVKQAILEYFEVNQIFEEQADPSHKE